ncbi:hypothetical protein [Nocardioides sp. Iso805N]|uniref:hypothetical protein n=1 Tax=Nocardioides sp. Iso805N TaxID=1283287 RepID=UPI0018DEDC8F|nr:hypothetical protein [Nocardioides sp. Iso805N]
MHTLRRLLGAAALVLGAVVPLSLAPTPALAADGCGGQAVAVVVDFGALGGGAKQTCVSGGGKASSLFAAAGHTLSWVQSQPGAVCSVDRKPADPCPQMPPANRYWGLFWANGSSSHWTYASSGVGGLDVPAGGSVAFAWQSAAGTRSPSIAPAVTRTAPLSSPSAKATQATASKTKGTASAKSHAKATPATKPTGTPSATASRSLSPDASPSAVPSSSTPTPSATASASGAAGTTIEVTASPSSSAAASTDSATSSADSATTSTDSGSEGLPGWVAPAAVVVVLAAGGGVAVARRRARG